MSSRILRIQRVLQPKIHQKLYAHNYHSIHRLYSSDSKSTTTDTTDYIPPPHKTAFSTLTSQKPPPPITKKYEYPKNKESTLQQSFDYCINELQKEEPQIYDTLQYLKCEDHERLAVIVLRVLHLELSRTRTDANTSDAARIRLQWWKSAINDIIKEQNILAPLKESTPLLTALRVVRRRYNLNSTWLMKLIEAREMFLTANTFMSMLELEEYAEATQTILLYLSMEVLTVAYSSSSQNHLKCASHIGVLMTIATVLRSIPYSVQNGFIALPDDIAAECDVWRFERTVLDDKKSTLQLKNAVEKMVISAYQHLHAAKDLEKQGINDKTKSLFLCCIPAQRYLIQLEKCGFDVFNSKLLEIDMGLSWKMQLVRKSMTNTF
eukprot:401314_1